MRVALVQQLGGIGSVELGELPDPTPAAGQAVVRVRGAGVGPWDVAMISGAYGAPALPLIPGFEVAGVVESVGDGVDVQPGERVYANLGIAGGGLRAMRWRRRITWRARPTGWAWRRRRGWWSAPGPPMKG